MPLGYKEGTLTTTPTEQLANFEDLDNQCQRKLMEDTSTTTPTVLLSRHSKSWSAIAKDIQKIPVNTVDY